MTTCTYNGDPIPTHAMVGRLISSFENVMSEERLEYWRAQDLCDFTAISGYPSEIGDGELGKEFFTGEEITDEHLGQKCWMVTDGHHRSTVLAERGVRYTKVEIDPSCFTNYEELKAWREHGE